MSRTSARTAVNGTAKAISARPMPRPSAMAPAHAIVRTAIAAARTARNAPASEPASRKASAAQAPRPKRHSASRTRPSVRRITVPPLGQPYVHRCDRMMRPRCNGGLARCSPGVPAAVDRIGAATGDAAADQQAKGYDPCPETLPESLSRHGAMFPVQRRTALATAASIGSMPLLGMLPAALAADPGLRFGPPEPFSFDGLIERARQLAAQPLCPAADAGAGGRAADRLRCAP